MAHIKLYGFAKDPNGPSSSGFCQKLETFLRASDFTDYELVPQIPMRAPKGKLPYIELTSSSPDVASKPEVLADSHFIIKTLVARGLVPDPDAGLSQEQRNESRAWQAWTEDLVYPAIVSTRWCREHNYKTVRANLPVPFPANYFVGWYFRRRIVNALYGAGVARHSDEEVEVLVGEWVDALEQRLSLSSENGRYFHGEKWTGVDAVVYGFLVNALGMKGGNPEVWALISGKERLREYVREGTRMWFAEYEGVLEVLAEGDGKTGDVSGGILGETYRFEQDGEKKGEKEG